MKNKAYTFSDFWHYNKYKIIAVVVTVFIVAISITQCSWGERSDLAVLHACETDGVDGTAFTESIRKEILGDKTGEMEIIFTPVYIPQDRNDRIETRALEKLQLEVSVGESSLYIVDKETLYVYSPDDLFENITDIADKYEIPEDMRYLDEGGNVIGISVDSNSYLSSVGLFSDSLYACVKAGERESYENAYKVLNHMLENR